MTQPRDASTFTSDRAAGDVPLDTSTLGRLKISRSVLPPLVELSATSTKTSLSTLHWMESGRKREKKISIWIREFDTLIQTSTVCMKLPEIQFKKVITFDKMLITDAIPKSPPPITVTLLSCWSWCLLPPEIDMRWDNLWWSDYCLSSKTNNNCIYIVYLLPPD